MSPTRHWTNLILPLGMIACVMVLLVPLPPFLMDVLLAANITIAVIVLLTAIQVKTPFEFGIFPVLLLATALARIVLNIATTRLILTRGPDEGTRAAGDVIQAFGDFVAGSNILVGGVIFLIILIVQFVVITKGATRISEVAARFTLDGMPGRQMAIDADLAAGAIDGAQARIRRNELQAQADFYGTMDGASKYVRGDAIAGLLITVINILGGLAIGISQGMGVSQSLDIFTRLTIGDGLVSQLPGLLIALAAGILISRSTIPTDLSRELVSQLTIRPQVLIVTGCFLFVLVFTQLPALPLIVAGGICFALAFSNPAGSTAGNSLPSEPANSEKRAIPESEFSRHLAVDPIEIELGVQLIGMASAGDLLTKITAARQSIAEELGLILPKVRVRDNLKLGDSQFRILINNLPVTSGTVLTGQVLLVKRSMAAGDPSGIRAMWPGGFGAWWVEPDSAASRGREYLRLEPADVIVETLKSESRRRAAELLTRQSTAWLIDQLKKSSPETVEELIPGVMKLGAVQHVLQHLLADGVSIKPLHAILEALADEHRPGISAEELAERTRRRLAPWITARLRESSGMVRVVELSDELQMWAGGRAALHEGRRCLELDPRSRARLAGQILQLAQGCQAAALLVPAPLRSPFSRLLQECDAPVFVTCREELARDARIETIAILEWSAIHYAAA